MRQMLEYRVEESDSDVEDLSDSDNLSEDDSTSVDSRSKPMSTSNVANAPNHPRNNNQIDPPHVAKESPASSQPETRSAVVHGVNKRKRELETSPKNWIRPRPFP